MATAVPTSAGSFAVKSRGSWFYSGAAVFALLFTVAAFAPSLVHTSGRFGPPSALVLAHAALCVAWLIILLVQSILVRTRRVSFHRRLGTFSAVLAAAIVVLGYQTTVAMARRGFDLSGDLAARSDRLAAMAFPLLDTAMFAVLFVAAYCYRKHPAVHKRLMLFSVFGALMPAPIAHLLGHYAFFHDKPLFEPALVGIFLAVIPLYDRIVQRRIHPASLWVALVIFAVDIFCAAIVMPSAGWHHVALRLIQ